MTKPNSVDEILTRLEQYNLGDDPVTNQPFTADEAYAIYPELQKAKQSLANLLIAELEGKKTFDTRGSTQSPDNPNYLTRKSKYQNQGIDICIETIKGVFK